MNTLREWPPPSVFINITTTSFKMSLRCATTHFLWATSVGLFLAAGRSFITSSWVGRDEVWSCQVSLRQRSLRPAVGRWGPLTICPQPTDSRLSPYNEEGGVLREPRLDGGGIIKLSFLSLLATNSRFFGFFGHRGPGGVCGPLTHTLSVLFMVMSHLPSLYQPPK